MKRYLMTDLNLTPWNNFERESLEKEIDRLNNLSFSLFGELGAPSEPFGLFPAELSTSITLNNVSHKIENIEIEGDKIYADVDFLKDIKGELTERGALAEAVIEQMKGYFKMRVFVVDGDELYIPSIVTWDVEFPPPNVNNFLKT